MLFFAADGLSNTLNPRRPRQNSDELLGQNSGAKIQLAGEKVS